MSKGAEWAWKERRVEPFMVLHVVSLNVEFGDMVQCWPVSNGGVKGVGSHTVKQFGYPKNKLCGLVGSPTKPH